MSEYKIHNLMDEQAYWLKKLIDRNIDLFILAEDEGFDFSWVFNPKEVMKNERI